MLIFNRMLYIFLHIYDKAFHIQFDNSIFTKLEDFLKNCLNITIFVVVFATSILPYFGFLGTSTLNSKARYQILY